MFDKHLIISDKSKLFHPNEEKSIEFLAKIKRILDKNQILFWLDQGTLLGAIREGKIIPWDTDIDLGAWYKDVLQHNKLQLIIKELNKEGIGYRVTLCNHVLLMKSDKYPLNISIQCYKLNGEKAISSRSVVFRKIGIIFLILRWILSDCPYKIKNKNQNQIVSYIRFIPKKIRKKIANILKIYSYFLGVNSDVFLSVPKYFFINLNSIYFYDMKFYKPKKTKEYLKKKYGEDWYLPNLYWDHRVEDGAIVRN